MVPLSLGLFLKMLTWLTIIISLISGIGGALLTILANELIFKPIWLRLVGNTLDLRNFTNLSRQLVYYSTVLGLLTKFHGTVRED